MRTYIAGLDEILHGGIPEFATVLIAGVPGTGKTVLCQNILFNVSRNTGRKVIYFSTISEPQIKVIRFQQQFSFFDPGCFMEKVIYHDTSALIREGRFSDIIQLINDLVREHQPVLVAIDSFKAIADFLPSVRECREFVSDLNLHLSVCGCTALLLGEYQEEEMLLRPEATIADGLIYIYGTEEKKQQKRFLRVLKMRGTDYSPGEHTMVVSGDGVSLYPRLNPVVAGQSYQVGQRRLSTGIKALDRMIEGGIPSGSSTLVSGPTGTGKSLLALSWLAQGCRDNEPGLLLSFDEHPAQVIQTAAAFGWELPSFLEQGLLQILHISPIEVEVDRFLHRIQGAVPERYRRVVIDSITTFELGMADKVKYNDYLWGLTDFFKQHGVALIMINETAAFLEGNTLTKYGFSYIADNIITLQYLNDDFTMRRLIGVLKMRGSGHDTQIRELVVGPGGPEILDRPALSKGIG